MHFFHYVVFFLATILLTRVHALYLPFVGKQDSVNNPYPAAIVRITLHPLLWIFDILIGVIARIISSNLLYPTLQE